MTTLRVYAGRGTQRGVAATAYLLAVVVALYAALGGYAAWQKREVGKRDEQIAALQAEKAQVEQALGAERQSREAFAASAAACSASVETLKAAADERDRKRAAEVAAAQKKTDAAQRTINEILARTRQPGMTECDAAKKELDDEIDRRSALRVGS